MGKYGEEEVVGLGENVASEVGGLNSHDVSGISDSNAAENTIENAAKEGFAAWKMYAIIGVAGLVITGIVVGLIIFMHKKKKTEDPFGQEGIWLPLASRYTIYKRGKKDGYNLMLDGSEDSEKKEL